MKKLFLFLVLLCFGFITNAQDFTLSNQSFTGLKFGALAVADVDDDLDLDILITGENNTSTLISELYLNDGVGNFSLAPNQSFQGVKYAYATFADVNNDNYQDAIIVGWDASLNFISNTYINNGSGVFTIDNSQSYNELVNNAIAFADIDDDSDEDILISGLDAGLNPATDVFLNDGMDNYFKDESQALIGVSESSIAIGDANGDDAQDIFVTGWDNSFSIVSQLYANDGSGFFEPAINQPFPSVVFGATAFVDIDGDTDQDFIILGQDNNFNAITQLYLNNQITLSSPEVDINDTSITIYPNPTSESVTITNPQILDISSVKFYDVLGRLVKTVNPHALQSSYQLYVSDLNAGAYFLVIESGDNKTTKRLIKQ